MRKAFLALAASLAVFLATVTASSAQSDEDPYRGLHPDVARIGAVMDSGNVPAILAELTATGRIIQTAYPGDGYEVSREVAEATIPTLIASNPAASDELGPGRFRVIGVWIPATEPDSVLIMASGIDAGGERRAVAFGLDEIDGTWAITSYGHVLGAAEFLDQWERQGDLRRMSAPAPGPPPAGTGLAGDSGTGGPSGWPFALVGGLVIAVGVTVVAAVRQRRSR